MSERQHEALGDTAATSCELVRFYILTIRVSAFIFPIRTFPLSPPAQGGCDEQSRSIDSIQPKEQTRQLDF